jgi:hypothetical protein
MPTPVGIKDLLLSRTYLKPTTVGIKDLLLSHIY